MFRAAGALFAASFLVSVTAQAADMQLVVAASTPQALHAKLVEAARSVCAAAIAHDPFGEFGTADECIANTISGAVAVQAAYRPR